MASHHRHDHQEELLPAIHYTCADGLLAQGTHAFHAHVASATETGMRRALPRMDVRFRNVSLAADLTVASDDKASELPTIANLLKKKFGACRGRKTVVRKPILHNVSGVFAPGTLTLVLGQPGSGKSSLLQLLSGRFPLDKNIVTDGEITYNGTPQDALREQLPQCVGYVPQRDTHFPTLTVKETLAFAHACCGGHVLGDSLVNTHFKDPEQGEALRSMYAHYPEIVTRQLGLQHCQETLVGDAMLRGVSGGEKKRVTTGEMSFGNQYVTLMDEISTGLDSAATYDIISMQRSLAKNFNKTVVISLLQPSPEVFALFDNVLLLNEGHVMYFGPRDQAESYFAGLGFVCPPHRDVADFLVDLGTDQQNRYEVPFAKVSGIAPRHPRRPVEFAELFERSSIHDRMLEAIHSSHDPLLLHDMKEHIQTLPAFQQPFWASTKTLIKRQLLVTLRNKAFLKGKGVMVLIMALLYGSAFYQFDFRDIQVAMGIIFFAVLYLALGQTSMLATYFEAREVFYKQRRANFYRTSSYVLSMSASQIPLSLAEAVVFGCIVYWLCGFVASAEAFVLFEALLFLTNLAFSAFFFMISCFTPNIHVAKPLSLTALLICILFSGFVLPRDQIPDYFIWVYWLDPIAWGVRSLAVSQYRSSQYDVDVYEGKNYQAVYHRTMGEFYLDYFDIQTDQSWVLYGVVYNIVVYVVCMALACYILENKRLEAPENVAVPTQDKSDEIYALVSTPKIHGQVDGSVDTAVLVTHHERHFVPVTLAFQDLWYTVPVPGKKTKETIDLLKGISGFAEPGKMTALMGSSGAGKTTLMDVIAKRKTGGTTRGKILLNGQEASDLAVRRATGYCEQMDIHADSATIREALTFSAFLRQDASVPASTKLDTVQECLELLDLGAIADHIVRGCSVEQLKRLTIGVELAAQPSVLFLDEPTSGLDARSAKVIMDGVRKVADSGRTVLCTIHQPSTEVFLLFDNLLLLKRGGETVYFGELGVQARNLIGYFEQFPGVSKIEEGYNPAAWMLDVIGAGVESGAQRQQSATDFVAAFQASPLRVVLDSELNREGVTRPSPNCPALVFESKRAATELMQAKFLLLRFFRMYWRTPAYNWTRVAVNIFLGVLFGAVFFDSKFESYQGVNGALGMVFMTTAFLGIVALNSMVPIAVEARGAYYRERASQTYNAFWYFVAFTVAEIPYVMVSTLLYSVIFYPMAGFAGVDRLLFFWINTVVHVLIQVYLGQLLAFALPSVEVAALVGVLFNSIFVLFMGFNPPASAIPGGYRWLFDITPPRYSFMLLSAFLFGECESPDQAGCVVIPNVPNHPPLSVKQYLDSVFDIRYDDIGYYITINLTMLVALRVLALLALRFINHQKK